MRILDCLLRAYVGLTAISQYHKLGFSSESLMCDAEPPILPRETPKQLPCLGFRGLALEAFQGGT